MKHTATMLSVAALVCSLSFAALPDAGAAQFDLAGPANSGAFGTSVTVLPNSNFVVTDPGYDFPGTNNVGAVYLYDGVTLAIISTLTGSTSDDSVGDGGVMVLSNGNYIVRSSVWNGSRSAVTWGSGTTGVTGPVSAANSLVGSTANDQVGNPGVTALANGSYAVSSYQWDNGAVTNAGAVTWGSGTSGVTGAISSANSLIGSTAGDFLGNFAVTALNNGNYVVLSSAWNGSRGAVTWGNGTSGVTGAVSAANSLVGSTVSDQVGGINVTLLSNGNYVVRSPNWKNGAAASAGAVTWCSGTSGVTGAISLANSLVGSTASDFVGNAGVTVLNNGNYVVPSPNWHNGAVIDAGAVTWGSGTTGMSGAVSPNNSLVGSTASDQVGSGVTALANGNYVVNSASWDNGGVVNVGAVTWGSGTTGVTGAVATANSLVGSATSDLVGNFGVTALNNSNYVVRSPNWKNGAAASAGAVTWGSGITGVTGAVSAANSLVGSTASDQVGFGVTALNNGNYVVNSASWDNGGVVNVGAATWGSGTTGVTGAVATANSLVGSTASNLVGVAVTALSNGNYVVSSVFWDNGTVTDVGAATWGSGTTGVTGVVSAANSLVGSTVNDQVGLGVIALNNGNYVVGSLNWHTPLAPALIFSAVTWGSGTSGVTGAVSMTNSLVGNHSGDLLGSGGVTALSNGNYVVRSTAWFSSRGAVTWGSGTSGVTGVVSAANSLVGNANGDSVGLGFVTALNNNNYVVSSPVWDNGALNAAGAVTWGDGTLGTFGVVAMANSVLGTVASGGNTMNFAYDLLNTRLLVGYPAGNRVTLFGYLPEIAVQQPLNINLADGGTRIFGAPVGANGSLTFTIKNINMGDLTGLGITIDGSDAALFTVTAGPTAPVSGPFGSTTFTVQFAPTNAGVKTAALHIANNDTDENPFDINLSGQDLVFTQDTDGDGLSDAAEFYLSALGFDWQVSQTNLVNTYYSNANGAGLYTPSQVQALNVGGPLIQRNPTNGLFNLTIGVQKATNLVDFLPFPMTAPQTTINAQGELEFQFSVSDNAGFFRLESK